MPRDPSGIYSTPVGTDGIPNFPIESAKYNTNAHDVETDLNTPRPIVAGGTGANNAHDAMLSLQGDIAYQVVTNYDAHPFVSGTFSSAAGATNAPVAGHAFVGVCYASDPAVVPPALPSSANLVIEARDQNDTTTPGHLYVREKKVGVWGAWSVQAGSVADLDAAYVNVSGDIMTGNLSIDNPTSHSVLQLNSVAANLNVLRGVKNSKPRWEMYLGNGAAESGGNVGSDFQIMAIDDPGTGQIGSALMINRASRNATFATTLLVNGSITSGSGTSGSYYFGNSGTKSLIYDGVNFNLAGGPLFTTSGIFVAAGGNTIVGTTGLTGSCTELYNNGSIAFLQSFNRTSAAYQVLNINSSLCALNSNIQCFRVLGTGFISRQGEAGATNPVDCHNHYWTGVATFWVNNTNCGNITLTSDYRIKKDVIDLPGMWDKVKALRPIQYTHQDYTPQNEKERRAKMVADARKEGQDVLYAKEGYAFAPFVPGDNIERWGFIAHELQDTLTPSMASGVKDQADAIQALNIDGVVAALTKALQEAMARIEALEAKIPA